MRCPLQIATAWEWNYMPFIGGECNMTSTLILCTSSHVLR